VLLFSAIPYRGYFDRDVRSRKGGTPMMYKVNLKGYNGNRNKSVLVLAPDKNAAISIALHESGFFSVESVQPEPVEFGFDYKHQAWVRNNRYVGCGHTNRPTCGCFGSLHAGEPVRADAEFE
jgi:hypothetical protein